MFCIVSVCLTRTFTKVLKDIIMLILQSNLQPAKYLLNIQLRFFEQF